MFPLITSFLVSSSEANELELNIISAFAILYNDLTMVFLAGKEITQNGLGLMRMFVLFYVSILTSVMDIRQVPV